jgi:eukaryotic-like serine/threonine-protein kinase
VIEFAGTDRFQVLRRLGAGGMGVVYEALDRERGVRVALKTLRTWNAESILRFKNEFRALADLEHPNLVSLGELISEGGQWFFTMELVDGPDFLGFVRPGSWPRAKRLEPPTVRPDGETFRDHPNDAPSLEPLPRPPLDEPRLRASLRQLASGLSALHAANKVHRDIKPSNILVARDGRVVLLDFGLAKDVFSPTDSDSRVVGTADYMAPEQAASQPVGPEADWYSVGVVLYEALTGQVPFLGPALDILTQKQREEPPPPRRRASSVPEDLDALCAALLKRDPRTRATGDDVLARLGDRRAPRHGSGPISIVGAPFVGRARELDALGAALDDVRAGRAVSVVVAGESGVGKSALVRRFLDGDAVRDAGALVLSGRCWERESVPYKAFDGVIDALGRQLTRLKHDAALELLPPDAQLLAQVFPVLWAVDAMVEATRPVADDARDPQELRARLFDALRVLMTRLAQRGPLIVFIDDLQWADADSLALLGEITRPPDAPPLLLCATARTGGETPPAAAPDPTAAIAGDVRRVELGRLAPDEARTLAAELVRQKGPVMLPPDTASIAHESAGHPLFIDELVRHALEFPGLPRGLLLLEDALWNRIQRLEPTARALLELVAVAGGPFAQDAAAWAFGADAAEFQRCLGSLRVANLVRTTGARSQDAIEPYHDRVRTAVNAHLSDERRRACHARLAAGLEATQRPDLEALCVHWWGAGQSPRAATYAARAAEQALRAFAFERAARLYRLAIDLGAPEPEEERRLRVQMAHALSLAGHGADAADLYLRAADGAAPLDAIDLKRRAAERYLWSGHVDEGLVALRDVLRAVGLSWPASRRRALIDLAWLRARLRLRGLGWRLRAASGIAPERLARVDACWVAASGLGIIDNVRGAAFGSRYLLEALALGEPTRVARGLATEAAFAATVGGRSRRRAMRLVAEAKSLANRIGDPHSRGMAQMAAMILACLDGRWRSGQVRADRAERLFRDHCRGAVWETDTIQIFCMWSLYYLGELDELARRVELRLRDAEERGDRFAATSLRTGFATAAWLMSGDVDGARREADEAIAGWSQQGFQVQHYYALHSQVQIDLYRGDGAAAERRLDAHARAVEESFILQIQPTRIEHWFLRARARLAAAAAPLAADDPADLARIDQALADARRIARERMAWAAPLALLVEAGAAALRRDRDRALALYDRAARAADDAEMSLHAACARRRRGQLLGGDEGRALVDDADDYFTSEGVTNPARFVALFTPG